jgi:membrane protein HdeD
LDTRVLELERHGIRVGSRTIRGAAVPRCGVDRRNVGGSRTRLDLGGRTVAAPVRSIESMESAATTALGHRWGWLFALCIMQIIAGCIAIASPIIASLAAVAIFGAVLILTAVIQLIHAFKLRAWPRSAWYGLGGVLYAIAGLMVALNPIGGAIALAVLIAVLFIADGVLRIMFAMAARPIAGWGWLIAAGIGSIVVGAFLLIGWPADALWIVGLLLGINLIFTGVMYAALALAARSSRPAAAA